MLTRNFTCSHLGLSSTQIMEIRPTISTNIVNFNFYNSTNMFQKPQMTYKMLEKDAVNV